MVNWWTFDNSYKDKVTNVTLPTKVNTQFIADRFGNSNSAVYVNNGRMAAASGVYFNGDFSVTAWVYQVGGDCRLIDFGNGNGVYGVDVTLIATGGTYYGGWGNYHYTEFFRSTYGSDTLIMSSTTGTKNKWVFASVSLSGTSYNLYINGTLIGSRTVTFSPANVVRTINYIGSDSFNYVTAQSFYLDDLIFYNKGLTATQVKTVMNLRTTV